MFLSRDQRQTAGSSHFFNAAPPALDFLLLTSLSSPSFLPQHQICSHPPFLQAFISTPPLFLMNLFSFWPSPSVSVSVTLHPHHVHPSVPHWLCVSRSSWLVMGISARSPQQCVHVCVCPCWLLRHGHCPKRWQTSAAWCYRFAHTDSHMCVSLILSTVSLFIINENRPTANNSSTEKKRNT